MQGTFQHFVNGAPSSPTVCGAPQNTPAIAVRGPGWKALVVAILGRLGSAHHTELQPQSSPRRS